MTRRDWWLGVLLIVVLSACGSPTGPTDPNEDEFSHEVEAEAACDPVTEIPEIQCMGLTFLYLATNGDNWTNNSGWLETNTPCSWFGVSCEGRQVIGLRLVSNRLAGLLPSRLGGLEAIDVLNLGDNQLRGSISSELGNLTALRVLILGDNQLTGSIPSRVGNLTNLRILALRNNQLRGSIPSALGTLRLLTALNLSGNQLTGGIPSELGNLLALNFLFLHDNQLGGLFRCR